MTGLEHSGSTLTHHLLGSHPQVLSLEEIGAFFNSNHMHRYLERWGHVSEALLCSCQKTWEECYFWGNIINLCGLNSDVPMKDKHRMLIEYIKEKIGEGAVVVDSSKSMATLKVILANRHDIGVSLEELHIICNIKDIRSFAASITSKAGSKKSFQSVLLA